MSSVANLQNFTLSDVVFAGGLPKFSLVQQFQSLKNSQQYDAVILLTNANNLPEKHAPVSPMKIPYFVLQLEEDSVTQYSDEVADFIRSTGGQFCNDVKTIVTLLKLGAAMTSYDGYVFYTQEKQNYHPKSEKNVFAQLLARQLTLSTNATQNLQSMHLLAKHTSIVSPYSSLVIVQDVRELEREPQTFERGGGIAGLFSSFSPPQMNLAYSKLEFGAENADTQQTTFEKSSRLMDGSDSDSESSSDKSESSSDKSESDDFALPSLASTRDRKSVV